MLELYVSDTCPYCKKVMNYFDENNVNYLIHDVKESENLENLIHLGGIAQVPFLYDKDKALRMYESEDIISYVRDNV